MTVIDHFKNDDLIIEIPVTFEAGSGFTSLAGASYEVQATDGFHTVTGAATTNPDNVSLRVTFAEDVFRAGIYDLAVRATLGVQTQTVATAQINVQN